MKFTKDKLIGLALIIISIIFALLLWSFTNQLQEHAQSTCACQLGQTCAAAGIPWQSYIGFLFLLVILIIGFYLFHKKEIKEGKLKVSKKVLAQLDKDEKKIHKIIVDSQGTIFQSELVEKSGFNKAKVTRILDKLEGKQVIERKRRGMTNVVILK